MPDFNVRAVDSELLAANHDNLRAYCQEGVEHIAKRRGVHPKELPITTVLEIELRMTQAWMVNIVTHLNFCPFSYAEHLVGLDKLVNGNG